MAALFTAPTAIRAIRKEDPEATLLGGRALPSLRTLFLAGERTDPDTLRVGGRVLGRPGHRPLVADRDGLGDGGELPRPRAAAGQVRARRASPCPGTASTSWTPTATLVPAGEQGAIAVRLPLPPGTLPTLWNDDERCVASYLARYPGWYLTGDGGHVDDDGYVFVMGRIDDVINVAGHRLSTGAMEEVVATHPDVAECAVFGVPDELRGEVPLGLVVLKAGAERDARELRDELVALVRERIGPVACFRDARVVARLPKTRSGKILRATMRDIAAGRDYALPATIDDPAIIDEIAAALGEPGRWRQARSRTGQTRSDPHGASLAARAATRIGTCPPRASPSSSRCSSSRPRASATWRGTHAYGCDAVSAGGRAYALVAPDGRIAVRLPDWDLFTAAFELPGSEPLYENHRRIGHWVLLPGAVRHDHDALAQWVRRAHELTAVDGVSEQQALSFGSVAEDYEATRPGWPVELFATAFEQFGVPDRPDVVDVAAGTGKLTRVLAQLAGTLVAVEPDSALLAILQRELPDVTALDGTAEELPLESASADVACAGQAFHWFDVDRALDEIARVLRPEAS